MKFTDEFIESNLGLVRSIASHYKNKTSIEYEDLCQEGVIGLIRAAEKFEPDLGYQFSTYATWWIKQKILKAIEENMPMSNKVIKERAKIYRIRKEIEEQGKEATHEEIAKRTGLSVLEIISAFNTTVASLDITDENGESSFIDTFASNEPSVQDMMEKEAISKMLRKSIEMLNETEKKVITARYFQNPHRIPTFEEISVNLGLTKQRAQQLEKQAFKKMMFHPEIVNYKMSNMY